MSARNVVDIREMHDVMLASSGVPPFIPLTLVNGKPAFDGGLVDNVPVEPLAPIEATGGRTLVLLTRLYRNVPAIAGRTYVQPSQKVNLSQFDITNPDGIRAAYELGLRDGDAFAASLGK
jgi:predicted patatin/cPLA2 family phospholipase